MKAFPVTYLTVYKYKVENLRKAARELPQKSYLRGGGVVKPDHKENKFFLKLSFLFPIENSTHFTILLNYVVG